MIISQMRKLKNRIVWKASEFAIEHMPDYLLLVASQKRRLVLSRQIDEAFSSTVRYGPFRGLRLVKDPWWGGADRASILLGIYEKEVLSVLRTVSDRYSSFVDVGAADGYYAVGALFSGMFERALCFEAERKGRDTIAANAKLNGVESRVRVLSEATSNLQHVIRENGFEHSVVLVDIEGAELDILSEDTFSSLPKASFIIETHSWVPDAQERIARLQSVASKHHNVTTIVTSQRDLSSFSELRELHDTDRWLICSEGRHHLTTWLCLEPKDP